MAINSHNGRRYKLEPYASGECFKLYESPLPGAVNRDGDPVKAEWLFTGKYPRDLIDGVNTIVDRMLADPEDEVCVDGLRDLAREIASMRKAVLENASRL